MTVDGSRFFQFFFRIYKVEYREIDVIRVFREAQKYIIASDQHIRYTERRIQ